MENEKLTPNQGLIVAISGASGAVYGVTILRMLKDSGIRSHLVVSRAAALSLTAETDMTLAEVQDLADVVHKPADIGATIASGSFHTLGMVVAPCSIKSLSEIATSVTSSLISRAASAQSSP